MSRATQYRGARGKYSPILIEVLKNRGIENEKEIERFLNPSYEEDLYEPFLLPDIKKILARIYKAQKNNEKVVVYGDFDVDGITATTLLFEALEKVGIKADYYLPDRIKEGYGLNKKALLEISKKASLVITVDCGIRDTEAVSFAKKLGLDVIITDHHEPGEELPKGVAVVDPKIEKSQYPERNLTAGALVFKIINALLKDERFKACFQKGEEKWLLDLVALATIADSVPLLDENRVLTKYGLLVLGKTRRLGLQALMNVAGIDRRKITSEAVSFNLSPRLNVAGRLSHADSAFQLLRTSSYKKALLLARELDKMNLERQRLAEAALGEALNQVEKGKGQKFLFTASPDWHRGIVGIIAGKLADNFSRPALAIEKGRKMCFGSARGCGEIDVIALLKKCEDLLIQFGGHRGAAGFSLLTKDIETLKKRLQKEAASLKITDLKETLEIDTEVGGEDLTLDLTSELEKLEPFGEANPEPVFLSRNFEIIEKRVVGVEQNHLWLRLRPPFSKGMIFKAIGFKMADRENEISPGAKIDLVFNLRVNEFNGFKNLDLIIIDFRISK